MMRDRGELVGVVSSKRLMLFSIHSFSKLRAYGMDDKRCALIRNYLSGRTERVKVGDTFSIGKRQAGGLAVECARSNAIQHFH